MSAISWQALFLPSALRLARMEPMVVALRTTSFCSISKSRAIQQTQGERPMYSRIHGYHPIISCSETF